MPNWCANSLKIKPKTKAAKTFMERKLLPELERGKDSQIFNLIVPMPQELIDTVCGSVAEDKRDAHKAQMEANVAKFGYPTWYEYAHANWGTKWDACELYYEADNKGATLWFDTAWAPPMPIYKKLEDMGFEVEATYCEQGMGYAGWYTKGEDHEHAISFWSGEEEEDDIEDDIEKMMAFFRANGLAHTPAHTGG